MLAGLIVEADAFENIVRHQSVHLFKSKFGPFDITQLSATIEDIYVADYSGNQTQLPILNFSDFKLLTSITIGYWCFVFTEHVSIRDLPLLTRLTVHGFSFSQTQRDLTSFCIEDCAVLKEVYFGDHGCHYYRSIVIQSRLLKCDD